jgi:hypothetical protein
LRHKIAPEQHQAIATAYDELSESEKQDLVEYFQIDSIFNEPLLTRDWRSQRGRVPKRIKYVIRKIRFASQYHFKEISPQKPYIVEWDQGSLAEQDDWDRRHLDSGIPPRPRPVRVYLNKLPEYRHIEFLFKKDPNLDATTVMEVGGSSWTSKRAEAALRWLKENCSPER